MTTQICVHYSRHHPELRPTSYLEIKINFWVKWWVSWAACKVASSDPHFLVVTLLCDALHLRGQGLVTCFWWVEYNRSDGISGLGFSNKKPLTLFLKTLFCTLALSLIAHVEVEASYHFWGHSNKLRRGSCGKQQANNHRRTEAYNNHVRGLEENSSAPVKPSNDCNPGQQPKPNCDFMNELEPDTSS